MEIEGGNAEWKAIIIGGTYLERLIWDCRTPAGTGSPGELPFSCRLRNDFWLLDGELENGFGGGSESSQTAASIGDLHWHTQYFIGNLEL